MAARPRRTRRRKMAIGGATIFLTVAGTAFASGLVSDIVRDHLMSMNDSKAFPLDPDGARRVASVRDGPDRLELYEAPAPDRGRCLGVVRRSASGDISHETGMECARGPFAGPGTSYEGNDHDGYTIYGKLPRKATLVELFIDGQPRRTIAIDNGYVIAKTGPAAWENGYQLVIRDSSGKVIGRDRVEGDEPCDPSNPETDPTGYDPCAER